MEPPACIADTVDQLPFDERVHIFVRAGHEPRIASPALEDLGQPDPYGLGIFRRQHTGVAERLAPGEAPEAVVLEEPPIEAERGVEVEHGRVRLGIEAARPEMRHGRCVS